MKAHASLPLFVCLSLSLCLSLSVSLCVCVSEPLRSFAGGFIRAYKHGVRNNSNSSGSDGSNNSTRSKNDRAGSRASAGLLTPPSRSLTVDTTGSGSIGAESTGMFAPAPLAAARDRSTSSPPPPPPSPPFPSLPSEEKEGSQFEEGGPPSPPRANEALSSKSRGYDYGTEKAALAQVHSLIFMYTFHIHTHSRSLSLSLCVCVCLRMCMSGPFQWV
mgnify:CR=1 FL=1